MSNQTLPKGGFFVGQQPGKTRIGLWAHVTELLAGHLHEIQGLGFDYLLIKTSDAAHSYHPSAAAKIVADAKSINLPVAAWAYVYPKDIDAQIKAIAAAIPAGITDLVLDAEVEWEHMAAQVGKQGITALVDSLCHGIAELTGHKVTLHLSSFWSPKLHSAFPFAAFMAHCATWQPQAYLEPGGARTAEGILASTLSEGAVLVKGGVRSLIPTVNDVAFLPSLKAKGYANFNVYVWDDDGDAKVSVSKQQWQKAIAAFKA